MIDNHLSLPVQFEQVKNTLSDERFVPVKIFIAHVGENRNNSIFSKEVLESMIPSLTNIPILGYILEDENGNDFKAHEEKLVIETDSYGKKNFKIEYTGHAYGLIPADNNARFENRYGDDGVEREYLVADGLLWSKFSQVKEIFDRDLGYKPQSMELENSSVKGYMNEQGVFVFTEAKFEGLCILGEGVTPAMYNSTIERFSVANTVKDELREMLNEFNTHFSAIKEKGDEDMEQNHTNATEQTENTEFAKKEKDKEKEKDGLEKEPKKESGKEDGSSNKEDQSKPEEKEGATKADEGNTPEKEEDSKGKGEASSKANDKEEDEEDKKKKKFTRTFSLSHDDMRVKLYHEIDSNEMFSGSYPYISAMYDDHAIVSTENGEYFKVNYVTHENAVSIGETSKVVPMFVSEQEKGAIELARNNFTALEAEVKDLRAFKSNIEMSEKENTLSQFSSDLTEEEYKELQESLTTFSLNELEKEIGFKLFKKNQFSTNKNEVNRVPLQPKANSNPYGDMATYFTK